MTLLSLHREGAQAFSGTAEQCLIDKGNPRAVTENKKHISHTFVSCIDTHLTCWQECMQCTWSHTEKGVITCTCSHLLCLRPESLNQKCFWNTNGIMVSESYYGYCDRVRTWGWDGIITKMEHWQGWVCYIRGSLVVTRWPKPMCWFDNED